MLNKQKRKLICFALLSFAVAFTSIACQPLKKKFTRKKKVDEEDKIQPVLDPIEYVPLAADPVKQYNHYYKLWWAFHKDLKNDFQQEERPKRLSYLASQCVKHLTELLPLTEGDQREELESIIKGYKRLQSKMSAPLVRSEQYSIMRQLDGLAKKMRLKLSPKMVNMEMPEIK